VVDPVRKWVYTKHTKLEKGQTLTFVYMAFNSDRNLSE